MASLSLGGGRARLLMMIGLLAAVVPANALAQLPFGQDGRARLRGNDSKPQSGQKIDDAAKKVNSDDPDTRLEGVRALGEMEGEGKAEELLMQAANDPDQRVRVKAIDTLGNVHAKNATPFLVQQLFLRDTDLATKQHILPALGKIGDKRATKPILDFMSRDIDVSIRGNAIYALGDIGDRAAIEPLEAVEKGKDEQLSHLARQAIRRIEERPEPEVVPPALAGDRRLRGETPPTP